MITEWDKKYIGLARYISQWSKDPSTQVGSVIVDTENRPISFGFNGLPQKIEDTGDILDNREMKYKTIIHAEMNAILFAKTDLSNTTIYVWPFQPCTRCASVIIQAGIKRIVTMRSDVERWKEDFEISKRFFKESGVELEYVDE